MANSDQIKNILRKGAFYSALIMGGGKIISFSSNILLARLSSPTIYGSFVYILAIINITSLALRFGLDSVLLRFVASYFVQNKWSLLQGIISATHKLVTAVSVAVISVYLLVLRFNFIDEIGRYNLSECIWAGVIIIMMSNVALLQSTLRALDSIVKAQVPNLIIRPVIIITLALFCYHYHFIDLLVILQLTAIATAITLLTLWLFYKNIQPRQQWQTKEYNLPKWLKAGLPFLLLMGINIIMSKTDIIMLGYFSSPKDIAVYSASVDISSINLFTLNAVSAVAVPMMAQLYSKKDFNNLRETMRQATKWLTISSLTISVVLISLGSYILSLYGKYYVSGYIALIILTLAQFINATAGPVGALLTMTGREKIVTYTVGFSAIFNIMLNSILIPRYGINGAAIATSLAMVSWNIFLIFYVRKVFFPQIFPKQGRQQ